MEFMDVVRGRRTIRQFRPDPIPREVLEELFSAAAMAPSAWNAQPWVFHVATGARRDRVSEVMSQTTVHLDEYLKVCGPEHVDEVSRFYTELGEAPVVVAVTIPKTDDELEKLNYALSIGGAVENLMLAATDNGIGTCNVTFSFWVRDQLAEVLEVPADRSIVCLVLLGYPAAPPVAPPRRTDVAVYLD